MRYQFGQLDVDDDDSDVPAPKDESDGDSIKDPLAPPAKPQPQPIHWDPTADEDQEWW